jgi:cytochrome P450
LSRPVPTGVQLTALDPRFRDDPYPVLAELREREPIHLDTELGRWVFTRHADVFEILRNPDLVSDPRKANPESFARIFLGGDEDREPSMLMMDDPGHRRLRELVRHPFKPNAVERWRPRVREIAQRVIGAIVQNGDEQFDLIDRVANPIPTVVIAELLGIDPGMHGDFKSWSEAMIKVSFSPVNEPADLLLAEEAQNSLSAFIADEIAKRRGSPGDDLISEMVRAEEAGDRLTEDEIISQTNLLLLAGNLTTTDLIGNGVMALIENPDQQAKLRAKPQLMKNAVEEILRYDSPVVGSGRIAHEDTEIAGQKVRKGDSLSVFLASANRDPSVHPQPDRFDIERQEIHHQSFGGGRHFCLGSHLARLEAEETLAVLLEQFPSLTHGDGGHHYASNPGFRGLAELWIKSTR